jgi:hypothetical protein
MIHLPTPGVCRVCGCSEPLACPGGCGWANPERTLCTRCVDGSGALAVEAGFAWMAEILRTHGELGGLWLVVPSLPEPTYRIHQSETPAIQCLYCGAISHHPRDIAERYCSRCKIFHEDAHARD